MSISWSQQIGIPNLSGSYLDQSYSLFNPAAIKEGTEKANILVSRKQGTGVYSVFNQNYLSANICLGKDSIRRHALGLRVLNDQAGKYIGVTRLAFLYSYSIQLSQSSNLTFGVAPTLINFRKKAQSFGGSDLGGNLDIGAWFKKGNLSLGATVNQVFKNELVVIQEVSFIESQLIFNAKYHHQILPLMALDYQMIYKINEGLENEEIIGIGLNYRKYFRTYINYELPGTIYLGAGLKDFVVPKLLGNINIDLIYGLSTSRVGYRPRNVIEIMLNYEF